jgi:glycosyltransferase involved in cell wall biosynthesis
VGQGRERGRLERLARRLGLAGHVDFLGEQRAVEESLRSARVFALASESEGVPAAAVEAMFCGLPAVLTDVGDVGSVFEHERNALLVPPGDLAALAEALARLLTDSRLEERLRQGALAARQAYLERWDIAGQVRAWETALAVAQSE